MAGRSGNSIKNCRVCGHSSRATISIAANYIDEPLFVCCGCGLVHTDVLSAASTVAAWNAKPENYVPSWPMARARLFFTAEFLDQSIGLAGKRVLDVSAGDGFFLEECRRRNAEVSGMAQSSADAESTLARGISCRIGSIETTKDVGRHDVVCINWTLENTANPMGMLAWAAERGKYVCVVTGSRILVPFKKPLWAYIGKCPPYLHPQRFSFNTLRWAMAEAGLKAKHWNRYIDSDWLAIIAERGAGERIPDKPSDVIGFFTRWHQDTGHYERGN